MAPTLLILKTGETLPALKAARGDFERWFQAHLGSLGHRFLVVSPYRGEPLPPAQGLGGVVVTGSPKSVYDDEPWIAESAGWLFGAAQAGVPLLGVCFGHQLVASAFGGEVRPNPAGRETGTVEVSLTDAGRADPLFAELPDTLRVQQSHRDAVVRPPEAAAVLAGNAHTPVQALALGEHVRTVQFHPEFDAEVASAYVEGRADRIREEAAARGEDPEAALARVRAGIRASEHGPRLLRNWLLHFAARA
ncbi:MAG: glutamine amidotransferase [Deltaproteobacteria bacterium]|nr:MAG: glutamine amidotransferase [Deltaproteobacteria bacterium]